MAAARQSRWSNNVAIIGFVITVLGVPPLLLWYYGAFKGSAASLVTVTCPRLFDKAHGILQDESTLAAPPMPGVSFTPSSDLPGRVDLALAWVNPVEVTQAAVAVEGVYGEVDRTDRYIDHQQPSATTGECWNWYHYEPRDDSQPKVVRMDVDGLWAGQQYCFYTVFRISTGYSKPTQIFCRVAPWKKAWGTPVQAPRS